MSELQRYLPALLRGAEVTLVLALLSVVLAICVGMAGAMAKLSPSRFLVSVATAYTTLIRGVPEFVMMLLVFYGGQIVLNRIAAAFGLHAPDVNAFATAVLTIGFIFGAYYTETFRGAILGVPAGQMEAARAYGFSRWLAFRRILFPQMVRLALPAALNNWLVLLKTTAIASLIGLQDVMFIADQAGRTTQAPMTFYLAACAVYLLVTSGSTACLARTRVRLNRGVREGSLHR
ncbi:ABC transporter permease subunit [Paraburkholderia sp. A1RI_3L]|jgi:histidine transport system permease protein|uniref:ABC transporter permease n=1 Tax=Paraburkholderia TaxID=1822464 RepID=UPI00034653F5|nr:MULTISPECIES: ABC transporter permease subunit [Paraburkholderia]WEY41343.1 ABC transporter permease subunit [Paraburkholderia sp. SUR17]